MWVPLPLSMWTHLICIWRMQAVIKSGSLQFQTSILGSYDEKLILRMFLGSNLMMSFVSQHSLHLKDLMMVRISSLIWRFPISFWSQALLWSASNLDLKSFVIFLRSHSICFSSISFLRTMHLPVSWVLLLWYLKYFPFTLSTLGGFFSMACTLSRWRRGSSLPNRRNLRDRYFECHLCLSWLLSRWSRWLGLCAWCEFGSSCLMYACAMNFRLASFLSLASIYRRYF